MIDALPENILPRLPGPFVAAALCALPHTEIASKDSMETLIDVPGIGNVRVTAKRMKARKGKSAHYFWTAERAIAVKSYKGDSTCVRD